MQKQELVIIFSVNLKTPDEKSEKFKKISKKTLVKINGDNSYFFIPDQKINKMLIDCNAVSQFFFITETIVECVNRFAGDKKMWSVKIGFTDKNKSCYCAML